MNLFPYGRAALAIFLLAVGAGIWILKLSIQDGQQKKATLTYWVFADEHYQDYVKVIPEFEREHPGVTVNLQEVSNTALASRLQAAMMADVDVPDLCELEIGSAGTMFRGPLKDVGFIDLKPRLMQTGLYNQMVQARFAPYTTRGCIFGLPHDVHPIQIVYRRDIFEKYGIDPDKIKTWDDFVAAGHKITIPHKQYMLEASDTNETQLEISLYQHDGGFFDENGQCIMDNEAAVKTMEFYVPLVAGPDKNQIIGYAVGDMFGQTFGKALHDGLEVCIMCPDWRAGQLKQNFSSVSGELAAMPLPELTPGGRRTSTWGGTMVGITKACKHPDLAWQLATFLYTNPGQLAEQFQNTDIVPPLRTVWNQPVYAKPDPYYSNQPMGTKYIALAPEVPAHYTAPEIDTATSKLGDALIACSNYYNAHGADAGWDPFVRKTLKEEADRVRAVMAMNPQ